MKEPEAGTIERWAWDYILCDTMAHKFAPGPVPARSEADAESGTEMPARRLRAPGRPSELRIVRKAEKTRGMSAPSGRARALHTFLHHELQAAELMAWAVLAFPDTPIAFRTGLLRIAHDEMRHMRLYQEELGRLGYAYGDFGVRDWFWERIPGSADPAAFVAVMGLGVESANLEHTARYAAMFREAGDEEGARVQEIIGREEIAHVRFGVRWFEFFRTGLSFETWCRSLPPPLTPLLMRGKPLHREARRRAGQPEPFLDELDAWQPASPGS
ncbi:ferritin-like domain-containing protein [Pendulispora brunnea]|uniref:Ferritin-like domain-containing protein n=1 Tax=Pendulispora brunnea TaxID=2905690 RepID=A0ABZ2K0C5_9BACT